MSTSPCSEGPASEGPGSEGTDPDLSPAPLAEFSEAGATAGPPAPAEPVGTAAWTWNELHRTRTVHEDEHVIVLDKPEGISVTGERHGTDVVRLAAAEGTKLRPVHRIDKVTSGLVVLALTPAAHSDLTRQFTLRQVRKEYLAVLVGADLPDRGEIDLPLVTASSGRVRIAAPRDTIGWDEDAACFGVPDRVIDTSRRVFDSLTTFEVRARDEAGDLALVALGPRTGRRHQIRVHAAWVGHPVAGDPLFRSTSRPGEFGRTMLHAHRLSITLPWIDDEPTNFEAPVPVGFAIGGRTVEPR